MWSQWYLIKEKFTGGISIRRYAKAGGRTLHQRYPAAEYKGLSPSDAEALVRRLNVTWELERQKAEERYNFDHAYINKMAIERFSKQLWQDITEAGHHTALMTFLQKYVLDFFVLKAGAPDPKSWKEHETAFGEYLLKKKKVAVSTSRQIIQVANRFLFFLHETYPKEVPEIRLRPLGRNKVKAFKALEAHANARKKYISPELMADILPKLDEQLRASVLLGYKFGLRCAETMGLSADDIYETELDVRQQLKRFTDGVPKLGPLKDRDERAVPYWFSSAGEAYKLISQVVYMHPKTLSSRFTDEMKRLGHSFEFHDLRRSFVTNALAAGKLLTDVKDACGHADVKTTMGYQQRIDKGERRKFRPKENDHAARS